MKSVAWEAFPSVDSSEDRITQLIKNFGITAILSTHSILSALLMMVSKSGPNNTRSGAVFWLIFFSIILNAVLGLAATRYWKKYHEPFSPIQKAILSDEIAKLRKKLETR